MSVCRCFRARVHASLWSRSASRLTAVHPELHRSRLTEYMRTGNPELRDWLGDGIRKNAGSTCLSWAYRLRVSIVAMTMSRGHPVATDKVNDRTRASLPERENLLKGRRKQHIISKKAWGRDNQGSFHRDPSVDAAGKCAGCA